jgi:hypothetical protein
MATAKVLNSATIEQQIVELINQIQILERGEDTNLNNNDFVSGTYNSNTGIFSATINIPCSPSVAADGTTGYVATEYLTDPV